MPKLTDAITYIQFIIYLSILVISIGICYAKIDYKVSDISLKTIAYDKDHESVLLLNERFERIQRDTSEIKMDLKEIKSSLNRR